MHSDPPQPPPPGDSALARALRGEPVLEQMLEQELPRLRAFVRAHLSPELRRRESSSDLVQSICRGLLAGRERFEFQGEPQFRAWLFLAARHKIADRARYHFREQRHAQHEQRLDDASASTMLAAYHTVATPSQAAAAREQLELLEQAIDRLDPDQREIVTLVRIVGLSFDEAGAQMGCSAMAARRLLGKALIRLGHALRELGLGDSQPPA